MTLSEVFRNAARQIEIGENSFCCTAIDYAMWDAVWYAVQDEHSAREYFAELFSPTRRRIWWWRRDDRDSRIVALCLAAAIAESEGE